MAVLLTEDDVPADLREQLAAVARDDRREVPAVLVDLLAAGLAARRPGLADEQLAPDDPPPGWLPRLAGVPVKARRVGPPTPTETAPTDGPAAPPELLDAVGGPPFVIAAVSFPDPPGRPVAVVDRGPGRFELCCEVGDDEVGT